jgi:hypothetical protein
MISPADANPSDEDYLRANEGPIARLRRMHPSKSDMELARALRQVTGLADAAGRARLIEAGLLLLD